MARTFTLFLLYLFTAGLLAQMQTPRGERFGDEWWTAGQRYLRVAVAEDGMYRIDRSAIAAAGFDGNPADDRFVLYHRGEVVPLHVLADGVYFYGEKARGEFDTYLFERGEQQQLNTRYGMHTDTAMYYLGVAEAGAAPLRYAVAAGPAGAAEDNIIYRSAERVFSDHQSKYYFRENGNTIKFSHYELAEGFGSRKSGDLLSSNGTTETVADLPLPGAIAGTASLHLRYGLAFGTTHRQRISVNGRELDEYSSEGWSVVDQQYTFPSAEEARITLKGLSGGQDKANLAFARVSYPVVATVPGAQLSFTLPAGQARRLAITGLPDGAQLYDLTNGRVYAATNGAFNLPAATTERSFQLVVLMSSPVATEAITLSALLPAASTTYLIVSSRRLMGSGLDAMATYRQSAVGGGHRVHTVYVEDLYDGYGYGYQRHPQGLKNYVDAVLATAPGLQYLFLIGKGREYADVRTAEQLSAAYPTFLIPGYGLPASDNLLAAPLGGVTPQVATGRLAAITPEEVALYVKKLEAVERQVTISDQTIEDLDWMKQALFLGGGSSPSEQSSIRYNLGTMERIFEESKLGGNVTSVFRTSSDPIETTRTEAIFDRINRGVSILTFYGHSGSQGFDFNIDMPENYENVNKYPYMMSLGCYSGDAFGESRSISERFIFLPQGGAVTFAASKGLGFISALGVFGRSFFTHVGGDKYGEGVGDVLRATIADHAGTSNYTVGLLLEQFALSGDPAFRFHPRPGPDVVIDPATVAFTPAVVPAQDTVYDITLRLLNLGTRSSDLSDSVTLAFSQRLPSGEVRPLARRRVGTPYYATEVTLSLPNLGLEAVGLNRLLVKVDSDNELAEVPAPAAEANNELIIGNELGVPLAVISNTARTAYPPRYGVVGPGLEVVASSTDPTAAERDYRLQVATDLTFRDPFINTVISAAGGVIRYTPSLPTTDSTTYYWRISPDSVQLKNAGFVWSTSNFTYLAGTGSSNATYAQQDPGQLSMGEGSGVTVRATDPKWTFGRTTNDVQIKNSVYVNKALPALFWNTQRFSSPHPWRVRAGVQVLVIDSTDNSKWLGPRQNGAYSTQSRAGDDPWSFDTRTAEGRAGLIQFLQEGIPDGKYVIVYTAQRGDDLEYHNSSAWLDDSTQVGQTIYGVLEQEGAEQVRLLEQLGSVPYTFAYHKGQGKLAEAIASSQEGTTDISFQLFQNLSEGEYTSDRIGPSLSYDQLRLAFRSQDIGTADSVYFRLYGETTTGQRTVLEEGPLSIREQLRYTYDLSKYSATDYPYLRVGLDLYDEADRSSPTLDEFYVQYTRPGDVAVSPAVAYAIPDSLAQGADARFEIGYENLSDTPMDSLLVALTITDDRNNVTTLSHRQPPLPAKGSGTASFSLPTDEETSGLRLQLTLNPGPEQVEEVTFNNYLTTDVGVVSDDIAPDLKVYYDGRRIRDGELISGKPEILLQLRDENSFRRLDDSSAYRIQLTAPDGSREVISMNDKRVEFLPAGPDGENMAEVYFRPELLQDGKYTLEVQASDRSKNAAGRLDYRQSFEVINQQLVSNVLAYPNPFTTQTQFVYTLTGSTPPTTFRIQIMTVSGRVVRDIDLLAHESVSPGTHRTDFRWDGTDEYGDALANGVYLYRVITSDADGQNLEAYDTGTDQYFRNGMGKVVILR